LPLVITQNLIGTSGASGLLDVVQLGYYPDATQPTLVNELLNVNVDLLHTVGVGTIWHFSGYIFASGRDNSDEYSSRRTKRRCTTIERDPLTATRAASTEYRCGARRHSGAPLQHRVLPKVSRLLTPKAKNAEPMVDNSG